MAPESDSSPLVGGGGDGFAVLSYNTGKLLFIMSIILWLLNTVEFQTHFFDPIPGAVGPDKRLTSRGVFVYSLLASLMYVLVFALINKGAL